ncbi:LruC domain-containing protein [Agaribacterium haliotis]|uniref:LruC domain-containing protein n=1 Tax=Agaribacterium haliotis TaxID=2013869 RepID=UPI001304655F|nr:LruC domain-containing protein [Agaribacterium haliotis]
MVQKSKAELFGVNLATGFYLRHSDAMGTSGKINAIGFNNFDRYIYGFSSEWQTLVQIGADYQARPVALAGYPGANFYVGDVSLQHNRYYAYRPGAGFGLYYVDLGGVEASTPEQLETAVSASTRSWQKVVDGADLNLRIYDFAFHPHNQHLYSVDSSGNLFVIDPELGRAQLISNVGERGTFGAVYFDADEKLYISRNSDGFIFRIDINAADIRAEFFAFGPSSSNNDGARCAVANILSDSSSVDFGDAPESYGSKIEDNGARHERSENLYLGSSWGGDDDGVQAITNFELGSNSILIAKTKGEGIANAWADWDQNGSFDDQEQIIKNQALKSGDNYLQVSVPEHAQAGATWTRFRYSSTADIGPNGGVADGEVEDYRIELVEAGVSVESYPSDSDFVTLAFEDNWPLLGDYDMNDVVVASRVTRYFNADNEVFRYDVRGRLLALGAGYHNGYAIQLDGISQADIDVEKSLLFINGLLVENSPMEINSEHADAVFIISNDLKNEVSVAPGCEFYRTDTHCATFEQNDEFDFLLSVALKRTVHESLAPSGVLNPFIFASPGHYHGPAFAQAPGRSLEIHLKNKPVSERFNPKLWGLYDDNSDGLSSFFVSDNNLPWALEVPGLWQHPAERVDLSLVYPEFASFVRSDGSEKQLWYQQFDANSRQLINNRWEP